MRARLVSAAEETAGVWNQGEIPVIVDPECRIPANSCRRRHWWMPPWPNEISGLPFTMLPLVIAVGPGFEVGRIPHLSWRRTGASTAWGASSCGLCRAQHRCPGSGGEEIPCGSGPARSAEGDRQIALDVGAPVKPGDVVGAVGGLIVEANTRES